MTELKPGPRVASWSRPVRTASITNLGCKVNQSEMEGLARLLRERGVEIVGDHRPADVVVINTCTVTATADEKSRHAVRRARRTSPEAEIVVTGCSVQVSGAALAEADPSAHLVDNRAKDGLLAEIASLVGWPDGGVVERPLPTLSGVEQARTAAETIEGIDDGRTVADRTRAFVKVQDGCSFYCTYCIIPKARGSERSLSSEAVLADVRRGLQAGHREIVLTGINIGTYDGGASERGPRGSHRWEALSLAGLIRRILAETDVERIRLSSIEPQHVTDELLEVWTSAPERCLPHFHLPLQSGDDGVLHRMGRRYDSGFYRRLVERIRTLVPGVAIHADVIVGFPTEDEAAWDRTIAFIREVGFAGLHVFRYSARPGTPATRMMGQVDEMTKRRRSTELLEIAAEARATFAASHLGRTMAVLFETRLPDGRWVGHAPSHVLVAAAVPDGVPDAGDALASLENVIASVEAEMVDPLARDRLVGRIVSLDLPRRTVRTPLRVVDVSADQLPIPFQSGGRDAD